MMTFTIRDFRSRPREIQEAMHTVSEALLTSNGHPIALMFPVDAEEIDEAVAAWRNARAVRALDALRAQARESGTYRMTQGEIQKLVKKTRQARHESTTAGS